MTYILKIRKISLTQKNFKKYFIIYFIIFGVIVSSFGAVVNYVMHTQNIQNSMDIKAKEMFQIKIQTILKPQIESIDNIISHLGKNEMTREFVISKDEKEREKFEKIFLALVGIENKIMQARILDRDGMEIIRVDRNDEYSEPFIIEKSKLQDKSQRDYFKILSKFKTETIWHSKLDLNIENSKIEIPYKPTIRVAMPIFNQNELSGIIIINILINTIFEQISTSSAFEHFIIDKDKNYILHANNKFSFNKYTDIKRELKKDFPNGFNEKGVYLYPIDNILKNDDKAIFILKTKDNYKKNIKSEMLNTAVIVFILTVVLSFIISFYVSKTPTKLQISLLNAHKKLKEYTSIIDRYIITATTKSDSTILDVSSAFIKSSGYQKDELIGKKMDIVKYPGRDKSVIKNLWDTINSKKTWLGEIQNRKKNGQQYWLEQHVVPMLNENNIVTSFVSIGIDITAKKELEKLATIDKLTGIYNRRSIDEFLQIEIEVAKRHSQALSLILIDIDHFKSVNDTYGHQTGDEVLKQTTKIISQNLRKSDIFGRWGGEEFVIISPQANKDETFKLAEKLRVAVENHKFDTVEHKTISIGIAELDNNDDEKVLIEKADKALYEAKNGGRNCSIIYV